MVLGAATIFERVEWLHLRQGYGGQVHLRRGHGPSPGSGPSDLIEAWVKAYAPGNPDALTRRLAWDGVTAEEIRAAGALSVEDVPSSAEAWTLWIDRYLDACLTAAPDPATSNGALAPFAEVLYPALDVAHRELVSRVPGDTLGRFGPGAQDAFRRHLLKDLAAQSELLLFDAFRRVRDQDAEHAAGDGAYHRFVDAMLTGGMAALLQRHPVAARQFSILLETWVTTTAELMVRLDADSPSIAEVFGPLGDVVAVDPGLSDPHHGRRRVAKLAFASGLTLVYKPRDVGLEAAFAGLIRVLADLGLDPAPTAPAVLARAGYGWIEFVRIRPLDAETAAPDWYRRAGALLCLAHLLRGRDLHMENVIATSLGPVLIDLELLLQPVSARERAQALAAASVSPRASAGSCLATGFVSDLHTAADGTLFDVGGLRGDGRGMTPVNRRAWTALGSDAIAFTSEPAFRIVPVNRPTFAGEALAAEDFADEVIEGFARAYRLIHERREELAAPGGPLDAFAGHATRVIGRPTDQYAAMLHLLAAPRYQQSGSLRSVTLDALNRAFATAESMPPLWPLALEERRSLEALDVPIFHARTDDPGVYVGDRLIVGNQFGMTGLDAVRERVAAMGEEDLDAQLTDLQRALWDPLEARFATPLILPRDHDGAIAPGVEVVTHALWIAAELAAAEDVSRDVLSVADYDLYDGELGPALFRAAIAATTGDGASRGAALETVARLDAALAAEPGAGAIGACSGDGSLIYALVCIGRLLDEASPIEVAGRVLARLTDQRIASDDRLDVSGGAAGAALALLALHAQTGNPTALAGATRCGERLLATARRQGAECSWAAPDGRRYVGFAHGAAGIGVALTRLFRTTGRQDFLAAAAGAHRFEQRLFQPSAGNWPVSAGDDGSPGEMMAAWCHGAPGLALARSVAAVALQDAALLAGVTAALKTTASVPVRLDDHLCCGSMGRCDVLLTVGEALRAPVSVEAAWRLALGVVRRAEGEGRYRLTSRGYAFSAFEAGFFRGLSGIGYQLLRLAAPSRLPSVLSFEFPPAISRS